MGIVLHKFIYKFLRTMVIIGNCDEYSFHINSVSKIADLPLLTDQKCTQRDLCFTILALFIAVFRIQTILFFKMQAKELE